MLQGNEMNEKMPLKMGVPFADSVYMGNKLVDVFSVNFLHLIQ